MSNTFLFGIILTNSWRKILHIEKKFLFEQTKVTFYRKTYILLYFSSSSLLTEALVSSRPLRRSSKVMARIFPNFLLFSSSGCKSWGKKENTKKIIFEVVVWKFKNVHFKVIRVLYEMYFFIQVFFFETNNLLTGRLLNTCIKILNVSNCFRFLKLFKLLLEGKP